MAAMSLLAASSQLMSFLLQLVFVFSATGFCLFLTSVFDPVVHVNVSFSPNHMDTLLSL
jgi:hypothetical protein